MSQHATGISDLEQWVDDWVSGGELKADILQDQRILVLQRDLEKIETRIDQLEKQEVIIMDKVLGIKGN